MTIFLVTIHIIASIFLILLVLLQAGKGSSLGASLGGGGSQALLGPASTGNILTKITTGLAIVFMITSISLAATSGKSSSKSVMSKMKTKAPVEAEKATKSSTNASDESKKTETEAE